MREYFVYFPFFILRDWGQRSAEASSSRLSGVALVLTLSYLLHQRNNPFDNPARTSFKICLKPACQLFGMRSHAAYK